VFGLGVALYPQTDEGCHPHLDLLMVEGEGEWKVGQNEGPLISEEKGERVGVKATYDHYKVISAP